MYISNLSYYGLGLIDQESINITKEKRSTKIFSPIPHHAYILDRLVNSATIPKKIPSTGMLYSA